MKHRYSLFRRPALAVAASLAALTFLAAPVHAQGKAELGTLVFDDIPSPEVNSGKAKSFKPKDWLEV